MWFFTDMQKEYGFTSFLKFVRCIMRNLRWDFQNSLKLKDTLPDFTEIWISSSLKISKMLNILCTNLPFSSCVGLENEVTGVVLPRGLWRKSILVLKNWLIVLSLNFYNENYFGDFCGGPVVERLPASAGDMCSIPGLGGSHMLQNNWAHVPQLLSLHSRVSEPQLLKPHKLRACIPQEKPLQWEAHEQQHRVASAHHSWRGPTSNDKDPVWPKRNPKNYFAFFFKCLEFLSLQDVFHRTTLPRSRFFGV